MIADEYREILEVSRKFAAKELGQSALETDLHPSLDWSKSIWMKSREVGFPGLLIPETYKGFGQSKACSALVLDTIASECAGIASIFAYHFAACECIMAGNERQKEAYLPLLANADTADPIIGTVVSLPYLDDNRLNLSEKNGKLILSGTSQLTGNVLFANYICVFLDEKDKRKDITCLLISRNEKGVKIGDSAGLTGLKHNPFAPVIFEDMVVDDKFMIGERGKAGEILQSTENLFNILTAAVSMGAARTAYKKARAYAAERYQYGRMIIEHQEMQRMLGNMIMKLGIGTSGYMSSILQDETGLSFALPSASSAKAYCTDAAVEIVIDAIQVHGGYGYMHDYGVEKIYRDVKVLNLMGNSSPRVHIQTIKDII
ncbi:MAG: acyl-CoA dehydrogenase family protein [Syntrophales bacterium]|jgi:alkylation response protein AidB-like acyl-CoA dehydrogenase